MVKEGFRPAEDREIPAIIVVNTCTVTAATDRQNRQLIRKLRRENPDALLLVTGCQAEVSPKSLEAMSEVDRVVGNRLKWTLPQMLAGELSAEERGTHESTEEGRQWGRESNGQPGHTRAFVKIQDGCDAHCTFCIVPRARGKSRSRPVPSVLREIGRLEQIGVKEIVLTGIHLGHYGGDLDPGTSLESLLDRILAGRSIPRIRLSSIEPLELEDSLLGRMAQSERICAHLHVPLQSGDDEILRRMKRPYLSSQYKERVLRAQSMLKDLTLGCDVIVGFPGETRKHFENTLDFLQGIPFSYLHVFPFSPRPGTPAFHFTDRVSIKETKERSRILRALSQNRRETIMESYIGRRLTVLVERAWKGGAGWMEGLTGNYMRVRFPGGDELKNRIIPVDMKSVETAYLVGKRAY